MSSSLFCVTLAFLFICQLQPQEAVPVKDGRHIRHRRSFRSYFYNYLDELAMSVCASIPSQGGATHYAVRRTCGEQDTCTTICTSADLKTQAPTALQSLTWTCIESLHVYKNQPTLADNSQDDTDVHKIGLSIYRHHSCTVAGCGPNYCCCHVA